MCRGDQECVAHRVTRRRRPPTLGVRPGIHHPGRRSARCPPHAQPNLAAVRGRVLAPAHSLPTLAGPAADRPAHRPRPLAVLVLTLGTAVAVATEFSLTALERSQVDGHAAQAGDRRARAIQRAHRDLSFELSGCQLSITITTLVTGFIAEPAVASLIRPGLTRSGWARGSPPVWRPSWPSCRHGAVHGVRRARAEEHRHRRPAAHRPGRGLAPGRLRARLPPLIAALNASANAVVRRLGVEPAEELRSARSAEELGALVRASGERGTLHAGTATLMDRSLRFTDRVAQATS